MPTSDDPSLKLIETIYRTALDPGDYDAFMSRWNDWMTTRITALDDLKLQDPTMSAPEIAAHFELALRLLERLGDRPSEAPKRGPQILCDETGRILWQNADADRRFGRRRNRSVQDFSLTDPHLAQMQSFLADLTDTTEDPPRVVQIAPTDDARPLAFRVEPMREGQSGPLALLSALTPAWPAATDQLLADTHKLSASEIAICTLLVEGLSPASIAESRETSLATVRTQIKKILAKTQTSSQPELVAHLYNLMRMAETLPAPDLPTPLPSPKEGRLYDITIRGRRVVVEEHGPKDGYPVVFVHGMLDGTGISARIQTQLNVRGLRLICPHRPGFGHSDLTKGKAADALDSFADDLAELLVRWDVIDPVLVGHMAGALFAYAAAPRCGARGIVTVAGGVPILSTSQFDAMTRRQRLVAYTALYAPSVLPFVVNAGIRQIKSGGIEKFMHSLYEHAPVDQALLQDDVVRSIILNGYQFTVAQGHMAFAIDSHHVVRDWSSMFDATAPLPVHLIHGTHDPVVGISSVRDFAKHHGNRVTLDEVTDAGQLVFYQATDVVLDAISGLITHP